MTRSVLRYAALLLLATSWTAHAETTGLEQLERGQSARELIDRMGQAMQTQNYRGVFVYIHDNRLESMRIVHRSNPLGEYERLVSLNGEPREIHRNNDTVTYYLPKQRRILEDKSKPRNPFTASVPQNVDALSRYYRFGILGTDRVAGRKTNVIAIRPIDQFRYGYRLWADDITNVLLRADVVNSRGLIVEQMMFTHVEFPPQILSAELMTDLDVSEYLTSTDTRKPLRPASSADMNVAADALPTGFKPVVRRPAVAPDSQKLVEHVVFTDGMASVSVFVSEITPDEPKLTGSTRMGALNAHGVVFGQHHITVVGDVPNQTVKHIAKNIRLTR